MKILTFTLIAAAAWLCAGCANPQRSRDIGNPAVPGPVLAQQVCSMCHGATGNATSPNFPNLAGQTEDYVVAQLTEFRSHSREDPAGSEYMWGITRHLSDGQIKELAAWYAGQTPVRQPFEGDPARVAQGRLLFTQGAPERGIPACSSCHGDHGQGLATFPRLAGQHPNYVMRQLGVFKGTNERPDGPIMKNVAHGLTPEDIANAASFVQGL